MTDRSTSYLPLARKYRPQTFDDLIGQPHVTATLKRALESKRIAQAYLFAGLRGIGKTSAARILAKCLNCTDGPIAIPCNRCTSCTQITQGSSLDVIEIDGASNRGIDEIRSLRETVPFAPTSGQFRVYIIDEVHMLTTEAFNALLKTLEEPPAHIKFIFATTAANKVPATILSRCQRFDFRRLDAATIVGVLKRVAKTEKVMIDDPAFFAIARAADGSLRDAEVVLDQLASFAAGPITEADVTELLGAIESAALIELTRAILERDPATALHLIAEEIGRGKDVAQILVGLLRHLRNVLVLASTKASGARGEFVPRLIDEPGDRLKQLEEQAGRSSTSELLLFLQVLAGAYEMVRRSPMPQTILELVIIKLCTREEWQSLEDISRRLEQLNTGRSSGPGVAAPSSPLPMPPKAVPSSPTSTRPVSQPAASVGSELQPGRTAVPADSSSVPAELSARWPAFLERLGAQKMSLAAYLMHASPLQCEQGMLTIGLAGFSLHHEVLSSAENRRLIDRLLSDVYQTPMTAQYVTLPDSVEPAQAADTSPAKSAAAPPIVQDIVNLFNATIINNPPRTT